MNEKIDFKGFQKQYHIADIGQGDQDKARDLLESFHIHYYIPSEDPRVSPAFNAIFHLPNLVNLIWLPADLPQLLPEHAGFPAVQYYCLPDRTKSVFTQKQFEGFFSVIHREIPGLVIDACGKRTLHEPRIRVTGGVFKGIEGVLSTDPEGGCVLVFEIPPLFSWLLPVTEQEIQVIAPQYSIRGC